jgi:hypothetical protein
MRFLNTISLALHEFFGDSIPSYAILSHRWEDAEVTFQDLQTGGRPILKEGWSKIEGCCAQAVRDGWEYAWVDSCCIDKTSSSELSEAINSIYQWYEKSQVCYVYLSDVVNVPTGWKGNRHDSPNSEFRRSKWFTRGWTLQELVAPRTVAFYDSSWGEIGTRNSLREVVSDITGIAPKHLSYPRVASVAQRMSWASKRKTTRVEDQAYSLLGLFNVNMPLLYGEGLKSFWRLQLEIMASSDDESILAWNPTWDQTFRPMEVGLIARHPADFTQSGNIIKKRGINTRPP